jgi:hypothetical protein
LLRERCEWGHMKVVYSPQKFERVLGHIITALNREGFT